VPSPKDLNPAVQTLVNTGKGGILQFREPALEDLTIHANRLLKFKFPVTRNRAAFELLIGRHLHYPRLGKMAIDILPQAMLESIGAILWRHQLQEGEPARNHLLLLFLLAEELLEYRLDEWVRQDVRMLNTTDSRGLHGSHYLEEPYQAEALQAILEAHGYRTDLLSSQHLALGYLACRLLSYPLPWCDLLETLQEHPHAALLERFPLLERLSRIHRKLETDGLYRELTVTRETLKPVIDRFQAFLKDPAIARFSANGYVRPVRKLVIVEGITEQLLIPRMASVMGLDLEGEGILILPAGGKNQVAQLYTSYAEVMAGPICMILDQDARPAADIIEPQMRPGDRLFMIPQGEFEDTYPTSLILRTINEHYDPVTPLRETDYQQVRSAVIAEGGESQVAVLKSLWKLYELGTSVFDKIHFATRLAESLTDASQVPDSLQQIIRELVDP
jgi:hypothetical protein